MKKVKFKKVVITFSMATIVLCLFSFVSVDKGWDVPAAAASVKNPVNSDATSIAAGKVLFTKTCKLCHGATGKGVGKMAEPSDFTLKTFKTQTDGAIFYKINTGHGKMPAYKTKIKDDNEKWNLVNYLRTL